MWELTPEDQSRSMALFPLAAHSGPYTVVRRALPRAPLSAGRTQPPHAAGRAATDAQGRKDCDMLVLNEVSVPANITF